MEQLLPPPQAQHLLAKTKQESKLQPLKKEEEEDPLKVFDILRYVCLYSLTSNGIPKKGYDYVRREILQRYGFRFYSALEELSQIGKPICPGLVTRLQECSSSKKSQW